MWVFGCDCSPEDIVLQESETCDVMWASGDKIKEMVENGEFIDREIYPYLDKLLEQRCNNDGQLCCAGML